MFIVVPLVTPIPAETLRAGAEAVEAALADCGLKHESLAHLLGLTPTQLSQQLHGGGHLSLWRLLLLVTDADGRRFLRAFLPRYAELAEVEQIDAVAAELARLTVAVQRRRMAKAEQHTNHDSHRRTA